MAKYDWLQLERDFVTGVCDTLADFCRLKGISRRTLEKHSQTWLKQREQYKRDIHNSGMEKAVDVAGTQIAKDAVGQVHGSDRYIDLSGWSQADAAKAIQLIRGIKATIAQGKTFEEAQGPKTLVALLDVIQGNDEGKDFWKGEVTQEDVVETVNMVRGLQTPKGKEQLNSLIEDD